MMNKTKCDHFCIYYGLKDLPEPEHTCSLYGGPIWMDEETDFNKDKLLCHAVCVEKEEL